MATEPAEQPSAPSATDDDVAQLAQFLSTRDVPCPGCGYNLRHLASSRCPECAEEIRLGVHLAEPKQGLLMAGLIGLSAGAGLSGLLILYALIIILTKDISHLGEFFIINGIGVMFFGPALFLWLRHWRRILRFSTRARTRFLIGIWASVFTFLVLFSIVLS